MHSSCAQCGEIAQSPHCDRPRGPACTANRGELAQPRRGPANPRVWTVASAAPGFPGVGDRSPVVSPTVSAAEKQKPTDRPNSAMHPSHLSGSQPSVTATSMEHRMGGWGERRQSGPVTPVETATFATLRLAPALALVEIQFAIRLPNED
ncbi:hypothetical protein B0T14DRAFT_153804 [Immersiella caudata]|uniref:Uncharacterized protein n=1 Tax=Immersiella caudata TaxID=314043 RepID=A0AA39WWB3_9PEZI|nr:hypothetical protein B0T14DRAFT_153804 [Immersiella caudata]